jgi:uncharacterized protein (DUF1778 family)
MATKPRAPAKARYKKAATKRVKISRLEARLSEEVKALLQQAADLRGETLTDFVLAASREKAVETLQEAQLVRLAAEDQKRFAEALLNPPKPSRHLRTAAERYGRMTG